MYIILGLIVVMYVLSHFHCPSKAVEVYQTDLASASDDMLLRKSPLVIVDLVKDHMDICRLSAFRLLHISNCRPRPTGTQPRVAKARFTLLFQAHADETRIEIGNPRSGNGVIIVLHRHQTLILPPRWRYTCPSGATVLEMHDIVSLVLSRLGM